MTARIHQSAPTERAFQWNKSWQTPWLRERKRGRIQPLYCDNTGGWLGYAIMFAVACMIGFALAAGAM